MFGYEIADTLLGKLPHAFAAAILRARLQYNQELPKYLFVAPDYKAILEYAERWMSTQSLDAVIKFAKRDEEWLGTVAPNDVGFWNFDFILSVWMSQEAPK